MTEPTEPTTGPTAGHYEVHVREDETGERLDRLLTRHLQGLSRSRMKALIETGAVSAAGATIEEASFRVKPGQTFAIEIPETIEAEPEPQAIPLEVIYEDPEVIVVNKPAGLVVHPAPGNPDSTLVNALLAHCGSELTGIGGVGRPGIVHRLDKDTSGLMIAAKTQRAQDALVTQFTARSIARRYHALVWGRPQPPEGDIVADIGRHPQNRKKMAVVTRNGKAATTRYRLLASYAGGAVSLVECRLLTGRTHQIRVHMAHLGHPLLGDPLYGRAKPALMQRLPGAAQERITALGRQALHAKSLGFLHPATQDSLSFESELSDDLKDLITCLESI
ncbi:RluA family pseudouridine synthase [Algihabitans albus]|uniref:RluA family pseudouridine synthase n=1 Tax=Algihabitans albus TaxID=2164067 RepID=UPI000E5D395E|nr:RluA family pseudouridine synthase [Algihabitans albus]